MSEKLSEWPKHLNKSSQWLVASRQKINQICLASAETPQLHNTHSSPCNCIDRQMLLTKQLLKRNASHLACTVQQMNGFCWAVSPGQPDRGLKSVLPGPADWRDKDAPMFYTHSFSLGAFWQLIRQAGKEQQDRSVTLLHLCGGLNVQEPDKGARRCFLCLRSHTCDADPFSSLWNVGHMAGMEALQGTGLVRQSIMLLSQSLPHLNGNTTPTRCGYGTVPPYHPSLFCS